MTPNNFWQTSDLRLEEDGSGSERKQPWHSAMLGMVGTATREVLKVLPRMHPKTNNITRRSP